MGVCPSAEVEPAQPRPWVEGRGALAPFKGLGCGSPSPRMVWRGAFVAGRQRSRSRADTATTVA